MARKSLILCDNCGNEAPEEHLHGIMVIKPGKKTGNKFEICPKCAESIQTRLVSATKSDPIQKLLDDKTTAPKKNTLEDLFSDDDFIKQKNLERQQNEKEISIPEISAVPDNDCRHLTKGRTTLGTIKGKKMFFQRCRDCKEAIPVEKSETRRNLASLEKGDDIRIKDDE